MSIKQPPVSFLCAAAAQAGGILLEAELPNRQSWNAELARRASYAPGCGNETHAAGTNGGTMPCGALLTQFGETKPYFCAHCEPGPT